MEDDFFDWLETADAEELESGTLDGFLEELERVDPLPGGFDPERSLAGFHEKYAAFLEPQSRGRRQNRMSRRAFWAVAAVIAVLASMVTVQAFGMDILADGRMSGLLSPARRTRRAIRRRTGTTPLRKERLRSFRLSTRRWKRFG